MYACSTTPVLVYDPDIRSGVPVCNMNTRVFLKSTISCSIINCLLCTIICQAGCFNPLKRCLSPPSGGEEEIFPSIIRLSLWTGTRNKSDETQKSNFEHSCLSCVCKHGNCYYGQLAIINESVCVTWFHTAGMHTCWKRHGAHLFSILIKHKIS